MWIRCSHDTQYGLCRAGGRWGSGLSGDSAFQIRKAIAGRALCGRVLSFRPGGRARGMPGVKFALASSPSGDARDSGPRAVIPGSLSGPFPGGGGRGPAPHLGVTWGADAELRFRPLSRLLPGRTDWAAPPVNCEPAGAPDSKLDAPCLPRSL